MGRRIRQIVQRLVDRWFAHGTWAQLSLLFIVSFLFVLFGTGAVFFGLFDGNNQNVDIIGREYGAGFVDAFWWSLRHAIDPGTFTADYGSSFIIVIYALIITLGGWAIFGVFVGLISTAIEERLSRLNQGIGSVVVSDHILILGWNERTPAVILRLFEESQDAKVVLLAQEDVPMMRNHLRLSGPLGERASRKVIFRNGVVTNEQDLKGVSFEHSARIIIMANDDPERDVLSNDIVTIELVSLLAHTTAWGNKRPQIVAEILDDASREIADLAGDHQIPVLTSTDMVSRVIVQCSRQPDLSKVYAALFSAGAGKLVLEHVPDCTGMAFIDILNKFPNATPIGVCDVLELEDRSVHIPDLNPPAERIIEEHEKIILMSSTDDLIFEKERNTYDVIANVPDSGVAQKEIENILILGWNSGLYKIVEQIASLIRPEGGRIKVVSSFDDKTAQGLLDDKVRLKQGHVTLEVEQANYLERNKMKRLLEEKADRVILLSDESNPSQDRDSIVKMALVLLHWAFETQKLPQIPHVIAEVIENSGMLRRAPYANFELISSPDIFSLMLTHFAQKNDLRTIATELLNPQGQKVTLKPATVFVPSGQTVRFGQLVRTAKMHGDIVCGVLLDIQDKPGQTGLQLNPPRDLELSLNDKDQLIVLCA